MLWKILMLIDQNGTFQHALFFLRHAVYCVGVGKMRDITFSLPLHPM